MPEGPFGGPRPLAKTRLKYNVNADVPNDILSEPPKAVDVLNKRVSKRQQDLIANVREQIGDVILAVNHLTYPNRAKIIDSVYEESNLTNLVPSGHTRITWTYVIDGKGIGEGAEDRTSAQAISYLYTVVVEGSNKPIERAQEIREFETGEINIASIQISTS